MKKVIRVCLALLFVSVLVSPTICLIEANVADQNKQDQLFLFLENVASIEIAKYKVELAYSGASQREDTRGDGTEMFYHFISQESKLDISCEFRDSTLVCCLVTPISGPPFLTDSYKTSLDACKNIIARYQDFSKASYLEGMRTALDAVTESKNTTIEKTNEKLTITFEDYGYVNTVWMNTVNGIPCYYTTVFLTIRNGTFVSLSDDVNRYPVGSADVKVGKEQAIDTALERMKTFSYQVGDNVVGSLAVLANVTLYPRLTMEPRNGALYPHWEMYIPLAAVYPGNVATVHVMMWADTGEISHMTASSTLGNTPPEDSSLNTPPPYTLNPESTQTPTASAETTAPPQPTSSPTAASLETPVQSTQPTATSSPSASPSQQPTQTPSPKPTDSPAPSDSGFPFATAAVTAISVVAAAAAALLLWKKRK